MFGKIRGFFIEQQRATLSAIDNLRAHVSDLRKTIDERCETDEFRRYDSEARSRLLNQIAKTTAQALALIKEAPGAAKNPVSVHLSRIREDMNSAFEKIRKATRDCRDGTDLEICKVMNLIADRLNNLLGLHAGRLDSVKGRLTKIERTLAKLERVIAYHFSDPQKEKRDDRGQVRLRSDSRHRDRHTKSKKSQQT